MTDIAWLMWKLLSFGALGAIPYTTWSYLYVTYKEKKRLCDETILHYKRHNCVVTFSKGKGHFGWCERDETNLNISNVKSVYEPFLYFINTARETLDIAVMSMNAECIIKSLISAQQKGVKVRVISNFCMNKNSRNYYHEMEKNGICITLYVSHENSNSIMHSKYIVKDHGSQNKALLTGSFNLTNTSFSNNYESVVFTTEHQMVEDFHENFSTMWKFLQENNKTTSNRLILHNAKFSNNS